MKKIILKSIPHDTQRYETVGDYQETPDKIEIKVSEMGNDDYEFLVALHELIEQKLCAKRGITEEDIDAFDKDYERNRVKEDTSEPGDAERCPYRKEHFFATNIERLMAAELGIRWPLYDETVENL